MSRAANTHRRVLRVMRFPANTCPASRHVRQMAEALMKHGNYLMFTDEPDHCAQSLLLTVEALWKARDRLAKLSKRQ